VTLTFDLLTLKVVSVSHVTWATIILILVFLGLSVLELRPMYATDVRRKHRLMPQPIRVGGIKMAHSSLHTGLGQCKVQTSCAGGRHNMPRLLQVDL